MLRFRLTELSLERTGTRYLPLPKLTRGQVGCLDEHLRGHGFSTLHDGRLRARAAGTYITVDPSGLAWSNSGLLDAIAPAMPGLLRMPRERTSVNPYFSLKIGHLGTELQLFPRMESLRLWTELRREGRSGLTEDELAVIRFLLRGTESEIRCVTDYSVEGSSVRYIGRKRYFDSSLPVEDFLAGLRTAGSRETPSAFLPRNSIIKLARDPPEVDLEAALREAGEWCYLTP